LPINGNACIGNGWNVSGWRSNGQSKEHLSNRLHLKSFTSKSPTKPAARLSTFGPRDCDTAIIDRTTGRGATTGMGTGNQSAE
jgi:hypothetical protein